ncbi:hypothetical protein PIB30_036828 [Stylosanthes scabra]|uniref:Uncharacterized protein n=1 Tax=Stylosanthes scabra TaxID=79078 RepID=A0ABU6RE96_9FABA|nr:hypothetical protein [Stylosanthes scabra]
MTLSVWATTMLSLYTKVQVNILGRHLYIDTARRFGISSTMESGDLVDKEDQQKFLGTVDFLSQHGMPALISDMEAATQEVLKGKQLSHFFNSTALHETIMQILNIFMKRGSPHSWIKYMMPEDSVTSIIGDPAPSDATEFEQLMMEARAVLLRFLYFFVRRFDAISLPSFTITQNDFLPFSFSAEFGCIFKVYVNMVVDVVVEQMGAKFRGGSIATGLPLARVLPQVAQICPLLLEEPSKNQFIKIINCIPEVEPFFTRVYANMPSAY